METYLRDLAAAQVRQGHQVTVIVHNHDWQRISSQTSRQCIDGVQVIRLRSLKPWLHTPIMLGLNRCIRQLMTTNQPDLIHLHSPNPSLFWLLFNGQAKSLPWVLSWHSDMVTQFSSTLLKLIYRLIKPFENKLIKHCQSILVSSQYYADGSPQLKYHQQKVKVIPLGIDTQKISEVAINDTTEEFGVDNHFNLFSLGRLTFYKNQQMLIAAMKQLSHYQLLLAGSGQLHEQLQQQINDMDVNDQVKLLGEVSEAKAQQLFAHCDVFCLASHDRAESFGVVLLEAMYHNKIILVADTEGSGMRWLAENYQKGFTFKANDVEDFVRVVQHIRENYQEIMARPAQFDYDIDTIAQVIEQNSYTQLT
ncbi:MAG: glycosyltransferase [Marinicella sp.]